MMLMTKEIEKKAQAQYPLGGDLDKQMIVAKFFDPCGSWSWYVMNQDPEDPDYLWGIVNGWDIETGNFNLSELQAIKNSMGLHIERDLHWKPQVAREVWRNLLAGKHV